MLSTFDCCAAVTTSPLQNFFIFLTETVPVKHSLPIPPSLAPGTHPSTFCPYESDSFSDLV